MRRFPAVEDIAGIDKKKLDINKVDKQMFELLFNLRFAATKDTALSKDAKEVRSFINDMLRQFAMTHRTIRLMLRHAYRKDDYPIISDTASLVREQIEKIYVVTTILQNPKYWLNQYLRNAWLKDYETYLLNKDEFGKIRRYDEFLKGFFPNFLETQRRTLVPRRTKEKPRIVVSRFAKRCARHHWYYPNDSKPRWFKRNGKITGYLNSYFYFPTPWNTVKSMKADPNFYMFLDRWYREYKRYSAFSHLLMEKFVLQHFSQFKSAAAAEKTKTLGETLAQEFILISSTAAATLCTLIVPRLSDHFGTYQQTKDLWESLYSSFLTSKALWNIYPKSVLN